MPFLASRASQTTISCFFMKAVFLRDACSCNKASSQTDRGLHHPPDTGGQGDHKGRCRATTRAVAGRPQGSPLLCYGFACTGMHGGKAPSQGDPRVAPTIYVLALCF